LTIIRADPGLTAPLPPCVKSSNSCALALLTTTPSNRAKLITLLRFLYSSAPPLESPHPVQVRERRLNELLILVSFYIDNFIDGVDQPTLARIFHTLIDGFEDDTVDSREDIKVFVRKSTMFCIQVIPIFVCNFEKKRIIKKTFEFQVVLGVDQHRTESH
jgi:hypothetical protein